MAARRRLWGWSCASSLLLMGRVRFTLGVFFCVDKFDILDDS
jgi:hypothetical protein